MESVTPQETTAGWKLTPVSIEILLHIYCRWEPLPRQHAPATLAALKMFERFDVIAVEDRPSGYTVTNKGAALVQMLCSSPLPESRAVFFDPRSNTQIC